MGPDERQPRTPSEADAKAVTAAFCGVEPESVRRFPMGLAHWVYDVLLPDGTGLVVRLTTPEQRDDFAGAVHWSRTLRPLGVPLPELLADGDLRGMPYLVLERLAGDDLGAVYGELDAAQRRSIAADVCAVQRRVATLPEGPGYGVVKLPGGPYAPSWRSVLDQMLAGSLARIEAAGLVDARSARRTQEYAARFAGYFASVRPRPFLDDTTIKNVLVHRGRMSGIVDVDEICYGDPLLTVAQTRVALVSAGLDRDYADYWCETLDVTEQQRSALAFYTAVFCVGFLSELGSRFNRGVVVADPAWLARIERWLEHQLAELAT